jgi:hypothetical protein
MGPTCNSDSRVKETEISESDAIMPRYDLKPDK